MKNKAMERQLANKSAIDISHFPTYGGAFILPNEEFVKMGVNYVDAKKERWIWSIGKRKSDGTILASFTDEFYLNSEFDILWLK